MIVWLDAEVFFRHKDRKLHKVLQFLQDVRRPVYSTEGLWNLWYNPVPHSRRAKEYMPKNIPPPPEESKSEEEISESSEERQELDLQVDESQFQRLNVQQQLNSSLAELVDEDKKGREKEGSESSKDLDGGPCYGRRTKEDEKDMNAYWNKRTDFLD